MTNEWQREKNIWHVALLQNNGWIWLGRWLLRVISKIMVMIGMITPESFSKLLGILGDKEKCIKSDEFISSKKTYRNFRTDARYFPFEARKETHEQRKTKIDKR
jgi:hypothetical protein